MENMDQNIAYGLAESTKCPKIDLPNLSANAPKFEISISKKSLHWASVVHDWVQSVNYFMS